MTALFVPIDVAVLCIGPDDQPAVSVLQNAADFSMLPWTAGSQTHNKGPYLSEAVLSGSGPFTGEIPYPIGVHLHWALPTALSRGEQLAPGAPVKFPTVPNRWLVVRLVTAQATPSAPVGVNAWIVESDRLNDSVPVGVTTMNFPTVPVGPPPADGQTFQYLGQTFPLGGWAETAASRLSPLTATGFGDVTFAAYYPNCCTSFGLLDTLADYPGYDPTAQQLAYVVCGWYSDAADDPLASGGATAAAALGWDPQGEVPTSTVLCGTIGNVVQRDNNGVPTSGNPLSVTLGPTAPQALSAALAAAVGAEDANLGDAEDALNALQCGLLPQSGDVADALPTLAETLHREGFARSSGGGLWTATPRSVVAGAAAAEPGAVTAALLAALNQAQSASDTAQRARKQQQRQLFSLWNAFQAAAHQPAMTPYPDPLTSAQLEAMMTPLVTAIGDALAQEAEDQAALANDAAALGTALSAEGLDLACTDGGDRFWQPLDPAMVLTGDDVTPVTRYTGNPTPVCRPADRLVTSASFAADIVSGSAAITVDASDMPWLPALSANAAGLPADLLRLALVDAVMTAPTLAGAVVAAAAAAGGDTNPAVMDLAATETAYSGALGDFLGGTAGGAVQFGSASSPDPVALQSWSGAPWQPIMLQYQASLTPFAVPQAVGGQALPTYPAALLSGGDYTLDAYNVDLAYGGDAGASLSEYQGQTLLSPNANNALVTAVAAYIAASGDTDPDLPAVQQLIGSLAQLSQAMEGLTDALTMLSPVLQLPVADPTMGGSAVVQSVAAAIGTENRWGPRVQLAFNPLRAGILGLNKVRLVDAFGRFIDYQGSALTVQVAASYAPPSSLAGTGLAYLAPRLCQPARVRFDWVDADGARIDTAAPAASPIFAYLLVNRLGDSLDLYTADGSPALVISLIDDGASALVAPPPGSPLGTEATFAQITAGLDADLVAFASAASAQNNGNSGAYLAAILTATNAGLETVLPARFAEDVSLAVLMGQPLALARAELRIETKGPTTPNQSWSALVAQYKDQAAGLDAGVSAMAIPVRLGAVEQLNDTLLGFFTGGDYAAFNAIAATDGGSGVATAGFDTVTVAPNGDPLRLTLLLDPRGEVNATTGLLPVKTIQLPPPMFSAALARLAVGFRLGTLLSGTNAGGAIIPLPAQNQGSWSWLQAAATGGWSRGSPVEAALQANSLAYTPQSLLEGWLVLQPATPTNKQGG